MSKVSDVDKSGTSSDKNSSLLDWINARFPLSKFYKEHLGEYYAPKNFNFWYFFGGLAAFVLAIQIVTGIFLVMNYKPDANLAFNSVEYIMRDVPWGWLIRYMHSTGASAFFIVVYLHIFRAQLYGSYQKPRELIWIFGCLIFLCLMAEAFMGYLLPWGQMSYWGAQVIVNLFAAIPLIGNDLSTWIRGDFVVSDVTLNRFFAFHVIALPLAIIGLVVAHVLALHEVGSNNPDGIEIKDNLDEKGIPVDGVPFHPYYTVHDLLSLGVFCVLFFSVVFFAPEFNGYFLEYNNFIPADPLVTPNHIAPVWYFTPFYSMLRATTDQMVLALMLILFLGIALVFIKTNLQLKSKLKLALAALVFEVLLFSLEAKFWGVVIMISSVVILFFLPWLDKSPVRSIRYKPGWNKILYWIFVINFFALGYLGVQPPSPVGEKISQVGTLIYFSFFLLMPYWTRIGKFKDVPTRLTNTHD